LVSKNSHLHDFKTNGIYCSGNYSLKTKGYTIFNCEYPDIYIHDVACFLKKTVLRNLDNHETSLNQCKDFEILEIVFSRLKGSAIAIIDESTDEIRDCRIDLTERNEIDVNSSSNIIASRNVMNSMQFPGFAILNKCIINVTQITITNSITSVFVVR